MIDRYLLRYFLAVIDHGTFSRAAEHCSVTQPTLSVGIAKLEGLLGQPLFHRSSRRVEMTPAGARFARHARLIENEFNMAERAVAESPPRQTLRIGILNTVPTALVADFLRRVAADPAAEQVEIIEGRERDLMERLETGRLEFALTIMRGRTGFESEPLVEEGYALAMAEGHPYAQVRMIAGELLADQTMIVRRQCELLSETSQYFTRRGVRPFFAARTMNDDRALAYVAAGLGLTVMPASYRAPGVALRKLAGFDFTRTLGIIYAHDVDGDETAERSPALRLLKATVLDHCPSPRASSRA